jgi:acetyl esterase/lipase
MTTINPELRRATWFVPPVSFSARTLPVFRVLTSHHRAPKVPSVDDVAVRDVQVPGLEGAPPVRVRLYQPRPSTGPVPVLLWIHGGGFIIGTSEMDQGLTLAMVRELGIAVASVDYRLAPEHPFPAAVEDCCAALAWLHAEAEALGLRADRVAVGGASAGGGLAAGLVLMAHDRGDLPIALQVLVYPMLDDRTVLRSDVDTSGLRMWSTSSNAFGWTSYLAGPPGRAELSAYVAPARHQELAGLPPAWVGVGTCDLFHDEDLAYATRLTEAGVTCELHVAPGAYHGFDRVSPKTDVVRQFRRSYLTAIRRTLLAPDRSSLDRET